MFLKFILKLISYYWETIRPDMKLEKKVAVQKAIIEGERNASKKSEIENKIDRRKEGQETMNMIIDLHDKIGKINSDYAGRFATRNDLKIVEDKVSEAKEDISNIKGQLGIK